MTSHEHFERVCASELQPTRVSPVPRLARAVPVHLAMIQPLSADTHAVKMGDGPPPVPRRSGALRIEVSAARQVPAQARAYAGYRLFGGLALAPDVRSGRMTLRPIPDRADAVVCVIIVVHDDGRRLRLRATGAHTYQAINRATEHLWRLTNHFARRAASASQPHSRELQNEMILSP